MNKKYEKVNLLPGVKYNAKIINVKYIERSGDNDFLVINYLIDGMILRVGYILTDSFIFLKMYGKEMKDKYDYEIQNIIDLYYFLSVNKIYAKDICIDSPKQLFKSLKKTLIGLDAIVELVHDFEFNRLIFEISFVNYISNKNMRGEKKKC